jgi:hypothetical protein
MHVLQLILRLAGADPCLGTSLSTGIRSLNCILQVSLVARSGTKPDQRHVGHLGWQPASRKLSLLTLPAHMLDVFAWEPC